jgi:signal transduction histidine kinase
MSFFIQLLGSGHFEPRGFSYASNPRLVGLTVFSDVVIAASCFAIPLILLWILHRRRELPVGSFFAFFGAFIVACGLARLMEVWNLWNAQYWLAGAVKAVAAAASLGTAAVLVRIAPQMAKAAKPTDRAEANASMEVCVAERTRELSLANDELRASRETLRLSQKAGRIGAWDLDLRTGIGSWTGELAATYGPAAARAAQEQPGFWRQFIHPEDLPVVDSAHAAALRDGSDYRCEFRMPRPDGQLRWITARGNVIADGAGKPLRLVGVTVDITDEKRAAEETRALNSSLEARVAECTGELSTANKELEAFSYSISHDLRSPLRAIDGFSLALLEDCGEQLDGLGRGHLQRIRAGAQRMGLLIDDLLHLSRVTRSELHLKTFDLSSLVNELAKEFQTTHPRRRIEWHVEPGLVATGDARLLRIACENLLGNALKFTSKHPAAKIAFGKTKNNGASAFFVKDDGAGFDSAHAEKLFGAFHRLHPTTDFPGTGIGLATVQRIVHRHGGRIWAESAPECGATFYFTLCNSASPEPAK